MSDGQRWKGFEMATKGQMDQATRALGMAEQQIIDMCARDVRAHGRLAVDAVAEMSEVNASELRAGDLVAIWGHQAYRAARVWKVGRSRVSAFYVTPTALDWAALHGNPISPNNITGEPRGLLAVGSPRSTVLSAEDLNDPRRRPLTATITFAAATASIVLTDADGETGEPLTLATEGAEGTARRMLTQLTGNTTITKETVEPARVESAAVDERGEG